MASNIGRASSNAGKGRFPWLKIWTGVFFVYLYGPIAVLIGYSFNDNRIAQVWTEFSTKWYVKAFSNEAIQNAITNSLVVAAVATVASTLFATMAALVLSRGHFRGQTLSLGIISLPLLVPEIATAVATLTFFAAIKLPLGLMSIIIAHIVFCIPFAFMVLWYVVLPQLKPGIIAGGILAFIISIDDFIISLMVAGAGATTLPLYIYGMIRLGVSPEINAVSTVLFLVSLTLVGIYWFISKQNEGTINAH